MLTGEIGHVINTANDRKIKLEKTKLRVYTLGSWWDPALTPALKGKRQVDVWGCYLKF